MTKPKKLIITNGLPPGDCVMLTGAIRDLHYWNHGKFRTDVRTPHPDLWMHNPYIEHVDDDDPEALRLDADYHLVHESGRPHHFREAFTDALSKRLNVFSKPVEFRGDIYMTDEEKAAPVHRIEGKYLLIAPGYKSDYTAKRWGFARWQEVVDRFEPKIKVVQVGSANDTHPKLSGVTNLIGKTSLRDLIKLVYNAECVISLNSLAMHLAAAVPMRAGRFRPCVVIAGAREPSSWAHYPGHIFLQNVGSLPCCAAGACWRSKVQQSEGDGEPCALPTLESDGQQYIAKCMAKISVQNVIDSVESYEDFGAILR